VTGSDENDSTSEAYRRALSHHGICDVQPVYRQFLRRLRANDAGLYEAAVERYQADVIGGAEVDSDPLLRWVRYGAWLAGQIAPGQLVAVDRQGRAGRLDGPPPLGPLLLHLPEGKGERGVTIALPADPSDAQEATRKLLCG
jgi:hypothetical protein